MRTRICLLAALAASALALSACSPAIETEVTRFHAPDLPAHASFIIQPEGRQAGSLEFQYYAGLVAESLRSMGWHDAANIGEADKVIHLAWGQGAPAQEEWTSFGTWRQTDSTSAPYPVWESHSITTYPLWLSVEVLDGRQLKQGLRQIAFEGRAIAPRTGPEISRVMPYLVDGLFAGFPGTNGQTVRITPASD